MSDTSQVPPRIHILVVPSAEEDDDMETLSLVGDVHRDVLTKVSQLKTYKVELISDAARDVGIIALVTEVAHGIIAQKELIIQFFQTGKTAIDMLWEQTHAKAIDMTIDGDHIHIDQPSHAQVARLIDIYEAKHPGKAQQITSSSVVEITGFVSKTEKPAISERSITKKEE